ncbi:peptidase [Fulvivirga sp. RKSG066]|uniref:nuclear transport factor 2 family protein n=1 Tax=Fulvivirga aurantia TaxID=2529383 RepID=UPI0012BBB0C8|nr:nuclear transport factor 2 family protein [Fulvivirga aurantia]MTI20778.1 peptidase [Fulvivirga aurantia]
MKHISLILIFSFTILSLFAQSDKVAVRSALQNYIDGTSYNQTALIGKAFYPEANLYLEKKDLPLWTVPSSEYIGWFKNGDQGKFNGRVGNILSIEYFNSIAIAKVEILIPSKELRYIDMFLLKKIDNEWKIISKSASSEKSNQSGDRILFIVSNAHYHGSSSLATGNSFSEIVNAYDTFKKAGYTVDFVSPEGGSVPLAYINTSDLLHKKYLYDPDFMYALKETNAPDAIRPENYKAVHYIGGGSAMYGVPESTAIQKISMEIYEKHKGIISSVCHGTAGIVHLKTKDGRYLVEDKIVSGYPDAYEKEGAEYYEQFPFRIQETILSRGGDFNYSPRNTPHIEVDGRVITGQNYLSSSLVAQKIIEKLEKR